MDLIWDDLPQSTDEAFCARGSPAEVLNLSDLILRDNQTGSSLKINLGLTCASRSDDALQQ